ncbi:uncharacterized protein LOC126369855 isoform X3 [Pectinophora gossypiella]|uniref:uncharacterized protein LOC126369855 isoform X3 n=1 Tax=Pectinophora gossypiella TaxID=13191 RepID=UPI00214E76DE|nr:uncharacterized protein LOC126369855 isoform X3 [Pectinophora gossypiella]
MGQCVSRTHPGSYAFSRHYDAESVASSVSGYRVKKGHSESKGAKKRDKSVGNGNKPSRGVATSFGFRRRPASTSRADDNARRRKPSDNNGNGAGSSEDLRAEEVLSGRSTPLARPRKETAAQPLRTNRFGFRQPHSKTARVGDVSATAEPAFTTGKEKETAINNNALDKKSTNPQYNNQLGLTATQVSSTGSATVVGASGVPKTVTKQTVILTYQPQQYAVQPDVRPKAGSQVRGTSATRVPSEIQKPPGKYTFQTNQLPRPQYPSVKNIDAKTAKQVVNNTRKAVGSDGWREGSAVSTDSGVWTGGEAGEGSPRSRRRPRNLEMVMRGTHSFHLRELQVADLDIMDEAVVTGHAVIPLPKLPSSFDEQPSPEYDPPVPTYRAPSPILPKPTPVEQPRQSPMSTLERYRTRTRPSRIQTSLEYKDEEKFVLDRAQPELLNKQNSFIKSSSGVMSPATVSSSKESSPSCKSEESHFGNSSAWQSHAAGEAMATRSQDDVSLALSVSSCEDEKSKMDSKENQKPPLVEIPKAVEVPKKTIVILDEPPVPHPLLMKSLTLSQHDSLRGTMMGSMTSSNYSTTSTCTNQSGDHHNLTLTLEESKFDMSALETSTQSLLDDETSPADSLISSTSTSDSNNDLHVEREPTVSSSAYQTANTKTRSPEPEDRVDGEILQPVKEIIEIRSVADNGEASKNLTPDSPGTPTHASGELSLSDGKDFFDDEIADQPALLFRKNTDGNSANKTLESEGGKQIRRSRERIPASPLVQRNRKLCGRGAERTASLDTLSSLASDDLMMDNDLAQSITSLQSVDDYIESVVVFRLDSSLRSGLNSLDERQLRQELSSSKSAVRQWSQLLEQSNMLDRQLAAIATGKATESLSTSTTSLNNIGASLPVRTARLLQRSRAQTPSEAGVSDGSASPAPAPASLLQDVVDIKTLLLQLKRVLQEPGDEHHSMSSETLDPLLAACAESPARGNGRRPPASPLHPDACAEMRRQILYLQSQLEERDRLVRVLQQQMLRMAETHEPRNDDTCNRATQTDRLRPPMSTALTSSENSGLVSWNEQASGRKLPLYSEAQKTRRPVNGTVNKVCQCGGRRVNGASEEERRESVQLRSSCRVGNKYLQALAAQPTQPAAEPRRYIKRDSSVGEKSDRRPTLYSARSRSIENFQNQSYSITEPLLAKNAVIEETTLKHHTSYGDLYNGRISSKESVNGNRHSPSLNGQSTDTDYSSDGGYKSLPSSINCNGYSPKKVSGIPRRSIEQKFISTKHVKASAL